MGMKSGFHLLQVRLGFLQALTQENAILVQMMVMYIVSNLFLENLIGNTSLLKKIDS